MDSPRTLARLNTIFAGIGYVVVCGIVVGGLLELGARTALHFYHHLRQHPITEAAFDTPAYSEYDWAKDCLDEQSLRLTAKNIYFPFRLWGVTEFHGRCMNNDVTDIGTVRRTLNPSQAACPNGFRTNIWIFGGSAVYGTSVPDWATLPSYLSSTLNTSMDCVRVVNLGVEGYVSNQELILLLELLKTGKRPNIVIFYDGFNDADSRYHFPIGSACPSSGVYDHQRHDGRISRQQTRLRPQVSDLAAGVGAQQVNSFRPHESIAGRAGLHGNPNT